MQSTKALQAMVRTGIWTVDEARKALLIKDGSEVTEIGIVEKVTRPKRPPCDICENEAYDAHFRYGRGEIAVCTKCYDDLSMPSATKPVPTTRWHRFKAWLKSPAPF